MTRVDERLAAEVVADEHPGGDRPEHGVDERDDSGGDERELQRRDRLGVRDDVPEPVRAARLRLPDERGERQDDDQRQERRDEAERRGRSCPLRSARDPRAAVAADAAALARVGPPTARSIFDHQPVAGRTSACRPAASRRRSGRRSLKMPGRRRELRPYFFADRRQHRAGSRTGAKRSWRRRVFVNRMNFFAAVVVRAVLDHGDRQLDQHRLPRDHVLDVLARGAARRAPRSRR